MDWLTGNWKEVLAAVGAVYLAARAIVILTPTPNDDAAVDKVGALLAMIGKVVGLDLTQGYTPGPDKEG